MKRLKKVIAIGLIVILSIAVLSACKNNEPQEENGAYIPPAGYEQHEDALHHVSCSDTDEDMLVNGVTEYKIAIPENATQNESLAASELAALFEEATGVMLETVADDGTLDENGKYISVGRTALLQNSSVNVDADELLGDGFRIKTEKNIIYICGGGDTGTLYGVYEFLTQLLGFETYAADCYSLDKNVSDLKLKDFDVSERPDFEKRVESHKFIRDDKTYMNRLRQTSYTDTFIFVNGREVHNSFNYLPPATWAEQYPEWYSDGQIQLCYTAHGDSDKYKEMVSQAAKVMEEALVANPGLDVITFTQEDIVTWCTCKTCTDSQVKYGTNAAVVIKFCNDLNKEVRAWMASDDGAAYARDLSILFFAYQSTVQAPVKKTDTGYEPIDDSVVCDDGVYVFYAPMDLDYTASIYDEVNNEFRENFLSWAAISKEVFLWLYCTNFDYYLVPYDNFGMMQELYNLAYDINAKMLYDQGQTNQSGGATGFQVFKSYLTSKFEWNTAADYEELKNNFFANYYGDAAGPMLTFYEEMRVHIANLKSQDLYGGRRSVKSDMTTTEMWPLSVLSRWNGYVDEALAAIEPLKGTDPATYDVLYKHVVQERIFLNYMMIERYDAQFPESEVNEMKQEFINDVQLIGLSNASEEGIMTDLISKYSA